jgi:release factor glutamine methyltransferase
MNEIQYINWWIGENRTRESKDLSIGGVTVRVNKDVFSPDPEMTNSSLVLLKNLPDLEGKSVLDIGTGCGILAVYAAMNGASRVTAVDIDPNAVANTTENVERLGLQNIIEVKRANLFDGLTNRYDLIVANLPILGAVWLDLTGPLSKVYERFLNEYDRYLEHPSGRVLMGFASFGDLDTILGIIQAAPYLVSKHSEKKFGVDWDVFEFGAFPERSQPL